MTSEGGQIGDNNGYYRIVKYDPVKRKEVGAFDFDAAVGSGVSCVDQNGLLWYLAGDRAGPAQQVNVSTADLLKSAGIRKRTECGGRRPVYEDGDNPMEYVPDIDKILVWCTIGRLGEAQAGELLEFDRSTFTFSLFPVAGTPAPVQRLMNNKMRYWPKQKVLVLQLATNVNARVIKLTK